MRICWLPLRRSCGCFGDDVEDDAGGDGQQFDDDQHDGVDERGEVDDHTGAYEFRRDQPAQHDADDASPDARPLDCCYLLRTAFFFGGGYDSSESLEFRHNVICLVFASA